jgi:predicted nucleic acid-binding protein
MIVYADTSALVKRLIKEDGADLVEQVWDTAERVISSDLIYPEARAALAAARRAGRLDDDGLRRATCRLERMYDDIEMVQTDLEVGGLAGGLAERYALRGSDAIHLAAALSIDAPRVVVTTWDRRLARASADNGLAVVPREPVRVAA